MSGFTCQLCGLLKYNHAGTSLSCYCKECWTDYSRFKYRMKKDGKVHSIKQYRKYRRAQGLSTPDREPALGRKPNQEKQPTLCTSCKEGRQVTEMGLCSVCRNNWSKWTLLDYRITPEVFWWIQKNTVGTDVARGYLGEPHFDLARALPPIVKNTLDSMTENQLKDLKKQFRMETG